MAEHETLIERLIPGDLEHQIPAAVQKVLPGGFKNRLIQIGLGVLLAFGLKMIVKRWIEHRERSIRLAAPPPRRPAIAHQPRQAEQRAVQEQAPAAPLTVQAALGQPQVSLSGTVDQVMYANFRSQIAGVRGSGPLVIAISTLGGDPEIARLMADEIRLLRESSGQELLFLGKVSVYSAGTVLMAAFPADKRYVTRGTRIMIHERTMGFSLSGSMKSLAATLRTTLDEIEYFEKIEEEGFRDLVAGSQITIEQVREKAPANWYIDAEEARALGLVAEVI
jgi:ATP-dependent protease ClpP protease subunit